MRNFKTETHLFGETETHGADTGGLDILSAVKDKRQAAAYEPAIKLFLSLSSKKMCIPFLQQRETAKIRPKKENEGKKKQKLKSNMPSLRKHSSSRWCKSLLRLLCSPG